MPVPTTHLFVRLQEKEESEEAMRNSTQAEESEEKPEGKRCKSKSKTLMNKEENTDIEHQQLPQKTEYSPGSSAETNKTR